MLPNRHFKSIFICLLIIQLSEQSLGQGSGNKRNNQQTQQRQMQHLQQQTEPNDVRKMELLEKTKDMSKYMNVSQDACKDFYDYACGNWMQSQAVKEARKGDVISVAAQLEMQVDRQLQQLLMEHRSNTESEKLVKDFYRSCTQAPAIDRDFILKFVKRHNGLPNLPNSDWQGNNYKWIRVIGYLKQHYNLDILISLTISKIAQKRYIAVIEEPKKTILPTELCSALAAQQIDEKNEAFNSIQMEIKDNLKAWLNLRDNDATRLAGDIQSFEFNLCKCRKIDELLDMPHMEETRSHCTANHSEIRPNNFHGILENMNTPVSFQVLDTKFNMSFTDFGLISMGQTGRGHQLPKVYLRNTEYFQHLADISKRNLAPSFAYYIMYRALMEITIPRDQAQAERPAYCTQRVKQFFPDILGNLYQMKYRREDVVEDLRKIFPYIRAAFTDSLEVNSQWLGNRLSQVSHKMRSLQPTESQYEVAEVIQMNPSNRSDYWHFLDGVMVYSAQRTLQQLSGAAAVTRNYVEAFATDIAVSEREIQYGWGLFQPPFYAANYPNSLKFSSLGYLLAKAIVKRLDKEGWHENPLEVNPWFPSIVEDHKNNTECFRSQVSNYFYNNPNQYRNGSQLREIIADSSAVNIAFLAYDKWLQEQDENRSEVHLETLPDFNFSNTQLFFINFAQMHCAARYEMNDVGSLNFPLDSHTLERFHINGPLSNGLEFGRDFNCAIGTAMNVDDKCVMF